MKKYFWLSLLAVFFGAFSIVPGSNHKISATPLSNHARYLSEYATRLQNLKTGNAKIDSLDAHQKAIELTKKGKIYVVQFSDKRSWADRQTDVEATGAQWLRTLEGINSAVVYSDATLAQSLSGIRGTKGVWKNQIATLLGSSTVGCSGSVCGSIGSVPADEEQWNINRIGADKLWSINSGCGVRVCVVDSGIDVTHPDLAHRFKEGKNFSVDGSSFSDPEKIATDVTDLVGHGTHVSGIIAGEAGNGGIVGVAPNAEIYSSKVFGADGLADYATVAEGIAYCNEIGADVINMSLGGGGPFPPIEDEIHKAIDQGAAVVVAAGNSGVGVPYNSHFPTVSNVTYPGTLDYVVTVAASDALNGFAAFSSEGPAVDLIAPGTFGFHWGTNSDPRIFDEGIYSSLAGFAVFSVSFPGDNDKIDGIRRFGRMSGTSMATPHVTGAVALLKSIYPGKSGDEIVTAIKSTAQDIGLPTSRQGAGLPDLYKAYEFLKN